MSDSLRRMEMVVMGLESSLTVEARDVVAFSVAGMMRLGRLVGKLACEVMVTEGLPLTMDVVAPSSCTDELVITEDSALVVVVGWLMRRVEVGSHS